MSGRAKANAELAEAADMMTDEPLSLIVTHGRAPLFLVGRAALQHKVCQFQQIMADGYHGYGTASLRFPAARNMPEFLT
jgi:hypothetical protein